MRLLLYNLILSSGCSDFLTRSDMTSWSALADGSAVMSTQSVSTPVDTDKIRITGQLFFNDLRAQGSFDKRYNSDGALGTHCPFEASECDLSNHLGAMDASVEIHSIDAPFWCENPMMVGVVRPDAKFDMYFPPDSNCVTNDEVSIGIRFLLRRCDTVFCGAMENTSGETWALWHPDARPDNPLTLSIGEGRRLAGALFQPSHVQDGQSDLYATAANHFATLIDAVHAWHIEAGVPFEGEQYGELRVKMPAGYDTRGGTQSVTEIHLPDRDSGWIKGNLTAHEYGHVLHLRAWRGAYDWNGPTHPEWSGFQQTHPRIAFKEGFANFAMRFSLHTNRCEGRFDDNEQFGLAGDAQTGQEYPRNVSKFLCDWHDDLVDDDPSLNGSGDVISASGAEIRSVLAEMKARANSYGGNIDEGLGLCDFITSHLTSIQDASQRSAREVDIIAAARNNRIDCGWN